MKKLLIESVKKANNEKRRLVFPLMGFPGLNLTGCNIKQAQQNFGEQFKVVKALCDTFSPDAIFPLMDLSVEANAIGRYTVFPKADSATVVKDHFCMDELLKATEINIAYDSRLNGYVETMKLMSVGLPSSVLRGAYVTGPYTLAALIMGADEAALSTVMNPDELHIVCSFAADKIQDYVRLLIASGAQIICFLEPSAVMLGPDHFAEFSGKYVKQLVESCKYTSVATVYHICGNSMHLIEKMCETGIDAISLDSPEIGIDMETAAQRIHKNILLIGNICPVGKLFRGNPSEVEREVLELLNKMKSFPNFILSTGCDLPQETPNDNIAAFMRAGKNYRLD